MDMGIRCDHEYAKNSRKARAACPICADNREDLLQQIFEKLDRIEKKLSPKVDSKITFRSPYLPMGKVKK